MVVWEKEKEAVNNVSKLKEKLEDDKFQMESHQREGNYAEASKYQYDTIPELEKTARTKSSIEKRLYKKKKRSNVKKLRSKPDLDDS